MSKRFGIIGGDRRQAELAALLKADGHEVCSYGLNRWKAEGAGSLDRATEAETVVLPLPLCKGDGVLNCEEAPMPTMDLFRRLHPEQTVLAGQIKPAQLREAAACGLEVTDYFLREELTVANAAATAEAALQVAMERLDRTLLGMECVVLGFGRIGKLLSYRLRGFGAQVTATARKPEDLAWIRAYGLRALRTDSLDGKLSACGVIFNTVPAVVLDQKLLAQLPKDCLCIDLASVKGISQEDAEELGLSAVWARSLPGRLVPRTAAEAIRDVIYDTIL